ncbi:MAG TPA: hypothetical protein PKB12_04025 [Elusimicrobiota bacterium]|nr:hypothetical protein [Elusimicrobiota bacterium]HNA61297.1 hypothetical protein [Elusimicrobiota bacterium]HND63957.1 hypothetical protein [Elusimicrobiota bacterium]HNF58165.1 hypothetical protein [Elusimicrobiota bacterium]
MHRLIASDCQCDACRQRRVAFLWVREKRGDRRTRLPQAENPKTVPKTGRLRWWLNLFRCG